MLAENNRSVVQDLKAQEAVSNTCGMYGSPHYAKTLFARPDQTISGGERREVSILMSDIREFTQLSETLDPGMIFQILNQYLDHMIRIIQQYNGIIVDFFGDAILVFFKTLSSSLRFTVLNSIRCAIKMQRAMDAFNLEIRNLQLPELSMGIGINTGHVIIGNIGSVTRAKYGIVGSAVNATSRIQAKADPKQILISQNAWNYAKDQIDIGKSIDTRLKGLEQPVTLYPIKY